MTDLLFFISLKLDNKSKKSYEQKSNKIVQIILSRNNETKILYRI